MKAPAVAHHMGESHATYILRDEYDPIRTQDLGPVTKVEVAYYATPWHAICFVALVNVRHH